jgi:hypothetical protein
VCFSHNSVSLLFAVKPDVSVSAVVGKALAVLLVFCCFYKQRKMPGISNAGGGTKDLEVLRRLKKENAAIDRDTRREGKAGLGGT